MNKVVNYLFFLAVILVVLAYYAGANQLLKTGFAGVNTLDLTATGRNASGNFAAYPQQA